MLSGPPAWRVSPAVPFSAATSQYLRQIPPLSDHKTKLTAVDGDAKDRFGESVAVAAGGTTEPVSAPETRT